VQLELGATGVKTAGEEGAEYIHAYATRDINTALDGSLGALLEGFACAVDNEDRHDARSVLLTCDYCARSRREGRESCRKRWGILGGNVLRHASTREGLCCATLLLVGETYSCSRHIAVTAEQRAS
jgi:hypothetical protein